MLENVAQVGFRVESVELDGADQAVDAGRALAATVGAGEKIIFTTQCDRTQCTLGGIFSDAALTLQLKNHHAAARSVRMHYHFRQYSKRGSKGRRLSGKRGGPAFLDSFRGRDKWNSIGYAATARG